MGSKTAGWIDCPMCASRAIAINGAESLSRSLTPLRFRLPTLARPHPFCTIVLKLAVDPMRRLRARTARDPPTRPTGPTRSEPRPDKRQIPRLASRAAVCSAKRLAATSKSRPQPLYINWAYAYGHPHCVIVVCASLPMPCYCICMPKWTLPALVQLIVLDGFDPRARLFLRLRLIWHSDRHYRQLASHVGRRVAHSPAATGVRRSLVISSRVTRTRLHTAHQAPELTAPAGKLGRLVRAAI